MFHVKCEQCEYAITIADAAIERTVKCPNCGCIFTDSTQSDVDAEAYREGRVMHWVMRDEFHPDTVSRAKQIVSGAQLKAAEVRSLMALLHHSGGDPTAIVSINQIREHTGRTKGLQLRPLIRAGLVEMLRNGEYCLTPAGVKRAQRITTSATSSGVDSDPTEFSRKENSPTEGVQIGRATGVADRKESGSCTDVCLPPPLSKQPATVSQSCTEHEAVRIMQQAGACSFCFRSGFGVQATRFTIPKPRWIGERYWSSVPRVVVVLINPGAGAGQSDEFHRRERVLFTEFHRTGDYAPIRDYFRRWRQYDDLFSWYTNNFGVAFEDRSQINIAWCSTQDNKYPSAMLQTCFEHYTGPLLRALQPHAVLLSGSAAHRFESRIRQTIPDVRTLCILHYAHRDSREREVKEGEEVRAWLARLK
jgi:hypothetical protein